MTQLRPASTLLRRLGAAALTVAALIGTAAHAADPRVGVSVSIGQPGFYGRVNIGDQPPPAVIYQQPIIVQQTPVAMHRRPIYLRVPPGHSHRWAQYCGRYSACGQPVYFVRYDERRAPRWVDRRDRHDRYDRHDHHGHRDRHDHNDRHDDHRGHGRGHRH